jgi:hypothetical protein
LEYYNIPLVVNCHKLDSVSSYHLYIFSLFLLYHDSLEEIIMVKRKTLATAGMATAILSALLFSGCAQKETTATKEKTATPKTEELSFDEKLAGGKLGS